MVTWVTQPVARSQSDVIHTVVLMTQPLDLAMYLTRIILGAPGRDISRNCFPPTSEREQNLVENTTTSRHIVMDDTTGYHQALWSLNNYRSQTSPDGLVPHRLIAVEDLRGAERRWSSN